MKIKRLMAFLLALSVAATVGCGTTIGVNKEMSANEQAEVVTTTQPVNNASSVTAKDSSEEDIPVVEEQNIIGANVAYTEYSETHNAEVGSISGDAKTATKREGYKGKGYVTGITKSEQWSLDFQAPTEQYYNVSITVASDEKEKNAIAINGNDISEFTTSGTGKFETIVIKNVHLSEGKTTISIDVQDGNIDIDYCNIKASDEISKLDMTLKNPSLVNKNADYNAKALYKYICDNYGKSVILGQYDTVGSSTETQLIYKTTGKNPAIRFGDMMLFTDTTSVIAENEIPTAEKWAADGGIVGYMWHWNAPVGQEGYYADDTDFDLTKAVTKEDVATMDIDDIKKLEEDGKVSKECVALIEDIDLVSAQLSTLQDDGIAVLWRPLHEASNGYFWWGKDVESYKWLWKLLYTRQTEYHKLNNLVWVWSAQNAKWYVGDKYCDILSVDVYDKGNIDGQVNSLLFLQSISKTKPIAMSECGNFPSIQSIADEKAMWAYIGQWGGNFLMADDGSLSEEYNTAADLQTMYNNNLTITREELPDFTHLANEIKQKEENSKNEETAAANSAKSEETTATTTTKAKKS